MTIIVKQRFLFDRKACHVYQRKKNSYFGFSMLLLEILILLFSWFCNSPNNVQCDFKTFFFLFSNMESRSKFQATCKQEKKTEFAYLCIYILSIKKRVKVSEKWIAQQFTVQSCNKNANNHGPNGTHGCVLVSERNCSCKIMTKLAKTITKLPLDYFVGVCILIGILGVHDFKVV